MKKENTKHKKNNQTYKKSAISHVSLFFVCFVISPALLLSPPAAAQKETQTEAPSGPQPQSTARATPTPAPEQVISVPQVMLAAEKLSRLLRGIAERLSLSPELIAIDQTLRSQAEEIHARQRETEDLITASPTRADLLDLERSWQERKNRYAAWQKTLTDKAEAVETDLRLLENEQAQWSDLLNRLGDAQVIVVISERIKTELGKIQTVRSKAYEQLNFLVNLQYRVSQQDQAVLEELEKITQAKARLHRNLFEPDGSPLWEARAGQQTDRLIDQLFSKNINRDVIRARGFLAAKRQRLWVISILFLVVLVTAFILRHRASRRAESDRDAGSRFRIYEYPVSLALLAVLMAAFTMGPDFPVLIKFTIALLFVIPIFRYLAPQIRPVYRPLIYTLLGCGLLVLIWEMIGASSFVKREVFAVFDLATIAVAVWLIRPNRMRRLQPFRRKDILAITFVIATLLLLFASLTANVLGYVSLSHVLRSGSFLSTYIALALYTVFIVTTKGLFGGWQIRPDSRGMDDNQLRTKVKNWGVLLLGLAAFALWLYAVLTIFTIREEVLGEISSVLTTPIKFGAAGFTLGDLLIFVLVLVLGIFFSTVIRLVLRENVLKRLPLRHGVPYAISTITYYLILLGVFLLSLSAAGVELSRFTVLAGAFGVGAGFGLQNVISNFASGIILLFERPISIGDFLEVGDSAGIVKRIGMRSSSIQTPQGAEVIVPNSNLIANQVINWTLSHQQRRSELTVKVADDTDLGRMFKLLIDAASSHPDVMRDPPPVALCLGFGDDSLEFELSFWVPQVHMHRQVKSDLIVKVAAALKEAGIEFPLPRHEVRVKNMTYLDLDTIKAKKHGQAD